MKEQMEQLVGALTQSKLDLAASKTEMADAQHSFELSLEYALDLLVHTAAGQGTGHKLPCHAQCVRLLRSDTCMLPVRAWVRAC